MGPAAVQQLVAGLHTEQHLPHDLSFYQASLSLFAQVARLQEVKQYILLSAGLSGFAQKIALCALVWVTGRPASSLQGVR